MLEIPHPYAHITNRCFVSIPFRRLQTDLQLVIDNRIQPEIGLDNDVLYTCSRQEFVEVAHALEEAQLSCTIHAPFSDLAPGATDRYVLQATRDKLQRAFALIPVFQPLSIVCHLNYEPYKHQDRVDDWFKLSLETWQGLLEVNAAHGTPLMFENTYETDPTIHKRMLTSLASDQARFCLDTGHVMAFAQTIWQDWLPALKPWLGQLHLHDNNGRFDEHLAIGNGIFDFTGFFAYLKTNRLNPIVTLEPHAENALWESLATLDRLNYFATDRDVP
jgi:sugar phosphate isomerase/epimerase